MRSEGPLVGEGAKPAVAEAEAEAEAEAVEKVSERPLLALLATVVTVASAATAGRSERCGVTSTVTRVMGASAACVKPRPERPRSSREAWGAEGS